MHWISFHGNRYQWKKQCWRKYPAGGHSNNEQMSIPQRRRLHVGVWSQRPGGKGQEPALCEGLVEVNHWLFLVPAKSVRVALEFYERQQCKGWAVLQRMQFRWGWSRYRKEWQHVAGKSPEVEHSLFSHGWSFRLNLFSHVLCMTFLSQLVCGKYFLGQTVDKYFLECFVCDESLSEVTIVEPGIHSSQPLSLRIWSENSFLGRSISSGHPCSFLFFLFFVCFSPNLGWLYLTSSEDTNRSFHSMPPSSAQSDWLLLMGCHPANPPL